MQFLNQNLNVGQYIHFVIFFLNFTWFKAAGRDSVQFTATYVRLHLYTENSAEFY